ncbi:hypothetical protein ABGB18_40100 [Nonomuraea sp. B12E4]|uniref:hypothetical protein n=1 Tax=Nonomuraea sp. B12E4 TaxID=3153564 RepID=UPI00325C69E2
MDELLSVVGADAYADQPLGLLSLDLSHQRAVTALVDQRRRQHTGVLFVTHEINPILQYVDRVLSLAGGRFRIGPPEQVMTSAVLSELYGSPVRVITPSGEPPSRPGERPGHHQVDQGRRGS